MDTPHWPEMWQAAYRLLEQTVVHEQLRAWIQPLELTRTETTEGGVKVYFTAPNDFSAGWVRDHYHKAIESAFSQISGASCQIYFAASENPDSSSAPYEPPVESAGSRNFTNEVSEPLRPLTEYPAGRGVVLASGKRPVFECGLNPNYNFESFVVGSSNQFAHASAVAVAEAPGRQYNPLFLYSHPGLGKTHLLHAIGNHVLRKVPNAHVVYLSAERFVNELIESLKHKQMPQFRTRYRESYDLILIDDIQFIAGKTTTEEEFFHTFNALHNSRRQIVVTSDRPPKEIEGLEERIRTRFEWGLVSDIHPPEIETRIAILKAKAERDDIYLTDEVATFLATHIKNNMRELEGALIKLQAHASLTGAEISLEMARQQLRSAIPEEGAHVTVEAIQNAVARHFHLKHQDFRSSSRARSVTLPRQIAMYLIRKYSGMGLKDIGQYFGGKDHTTVLHACEKIETGLENDSTIREAVEAIQNLL